MSVLLDSRTDYSVLHNSLADSPGGIKAHIRKSRSFTTTLLLFKSHTRNMPPPTLAEALKLDPSGYDKEVIEAKIQHLKTPQEPQEQTNIELFVTLQNTIISASKPNPAPVEDTHHHAIAAKEILYGVMLLIDSANDDVREWIEEAMEKGEVQSTSKTDEEKLIWMVVLVRVGVIWGFNYTALLQCLFMGDGWAAGIVVLDQAYMVAALAELKGEGKEKTEGKDTDSEPSST